MCPPAASDSESMFSKCVSNEVPKATWSTRTNVLTSNILGGMIAECESEPIRGVFVKKLDPDNRALVRHTRGTLSGVCAAHRTRGASPVATATQVFFFTSEAMTEALCPVALLWIPPLYTPCPPLDPPPVGSLSAPRPLPGSVPAAHHGHPCDLFKVRQ